MNSTFDYPVRIYFTRDMYIDTDNTVDKYTNLKIIDFLIKKMDLKSENVIFMFRRKEDYNDFVSLIKENIDTYYNLYNILANGIIYKIIPNLKQRHSKKIQDDSLVITVIEKGKVIKHIIFTEVNMIYNIIFMYFYAIDGYKLIVSDTLVKNQKYLLHYICLLGSIEYFNKNIDENIASTIKNSLI